MHNPGFAAASTNTISKDYFIRGLQCDLQRELRKEKDLKTMSLKDITERTTFLELAGVNSQSFKEETIGAVREPSILEEKLDKLITVLETSAGTRVESDENINFAGTGRSKRGRGSYQGSRYSQDHIRDHNTRGSYQGSRYSQRGKKKLPCRVCTSTEHLFRQCPSRYCQACGGQGHDGWQKICPKYI